MTTITDASESFAQRFVDSALSETVPYVLDNESFASDALEVPWIRITDSLATSKQTLGGIGNRKFTRHGILFIQIFAPSNTGQFAAKSLAKSLLGLYESVSFDNIKCEAGVIRSIPNSNDARWYQLELNVDFFYQEVK